jgi:hypothetical protein
MLSRRGMQKEPLQKQEADQSQEGKGVSWWSWRPGMKPVYAFLFGGVVSLLALFLLVNGAATLSAGILDSSAPPVGIPGIVAQHTKDILGSPELVIHLAQVGMPAEITLVVLPATATALPDGTHLTIDYAPHLRAPEALENAGRRYTLPDNGTGNLIATLSLLLFGLLLLPYPFLLACWGWRDLRSHQAYQVTGTIVALRAAQQTTTRTPGMIRRTIRTWHGVALQREDAPEAKPLTFGVQSEIYERLHTGDTIQVTYSPHLHYLYKLKHIEKGV